MSATIPRELKVLVERVVRPLPLPLARQKRMRTEFLQHLQAAYADEMALGGDSTAALARVAERFGDPIQLTAELQSTIRPWERWEGRLESCWAQRPSESLSQYAARMLTRFLRFELLCLLWVLLMMLDHHFFGSVRHSWRDIAGVFVAATFLAAWVGGLLLFSLHIGAEWARPQLRWPRIILYSLGFAATWPLSLTGLMVFAAGTWPDGSVALVASILGIAAGAAASVMGVLHYRNTLYRREWAGLNLNQA